MQLPQRPRLKRNNRRSNRLRHRKIPRIHSLDRPTTTRDLFSSDLTRFEDVGAVAFESAVGGVDGEVGGAEVCFEDVGVWGGDGG
jgi:hypothetical protein